MLKLILTALAVLWSGAAQAQSCTIVPIAPETGVGEVSGFVLTEQPLCYFYDRTSGSGQARLTADNACFTPEGLADCTRDFTFRGGPNGFRFVVQQDQLRAGHETFTLSLKVH